MIFWAIVVVVLIFLWLVWVLLRLEDVTFAEILDLIFSRKEYKTKCLREFVGNEVMVYTFITHSRGGRWKVKNVPEKAHFFRKERSVYEGV